MNTDQIAAETWENAKQIEKREGTQSAIRIIKSAIEKATEGARDENTAHQVKIANLRSLLQRAQPMVYQFEHRVYHGNTALADEIRAALAHANEIDPVSGYRYDQEIPEPICEMKQIEPAHASECLAEGVSHDHRICEARKIKAEDTPL